MKIKIIAVLLIFLFSCQKEDFEIAVPENNISEKLVVHSTLRPFSFTSNNQLLTVEIQATTSFNDETRKKIISDATVILKKNNTETDTLEYIDSLKTYLIDLNNIANYPIANDTFTITVNRQDYKTVSSKTILPDKVAITGSDIIPIAFFDDSEPARPVSEASINFNDPAETENYYELILSDITEREDTYFELTTNNKFITSESYYPTSFEFDKTKPKSLLFSDKMFNGQEVAINVFYMCPFIIIEGIKTIPTHYITIHLRNVTKEYYLYKTTAMKQRYSLQENILYGVGEPVDIYTNIKNGYGLFGAYNYDINQHRIEEIIIDEK